VEDELTEGKLPNGKRLVSAENLLERRKPQVPLGEDASYGMGLEENHKYGVSVISHGGSMAGFKSNWYAIPSAGVGAVVLTNADTGNMLLGPFMRRLLEVLYDGKPEAEGDLAASAARYKAQLAKDRERLQVPADPALVGKLAKNYHSEALGDIRVSGESTKTVFDFGEWKSAVATRKNDDGSVSIITIDPTNDGFEFVIGERGGKRTLTIRDGQHEYVFTEIS
jgi:hypothetical protein